MASYLIRYALDPTLVMGVKDQQSGAQLVLRSIGDDPNLMIWNFSTLSPILKLASVGGVGLCATIGTFNCGGTPILTLAAPLPKTDAKSAYQRWRTLGPTTFITSEGCPNRVADAQSRQVQPGTPIWLYDYNGSPAQQWTFEALMASDVESAISPRG